MPVPNVQLKTPDDGRRNCPKHVDFLYKSKFGKISASTSFIKKIFVMMHGHMNIKFIFLMFIGCVNVVYRFIFSLFSCIFIIAVSN